MQKLLLAALLAAIPSIASAQVGYVEGAIGLVLIPDVETEDYSIFVPGYGQFEGRAEADFNQEFSGGAELGMTTGRWRFGASWDFASAQLDTARLLGTLDGVPFSDEATDDELADFGLSLDNNVHVFAAHAYCNLGPIDATVRPYVGLGGGVATFEKASSELALSATAGARFALGPASYVGVRYRFTYVQGPEDDLGISYDAITFHTFSLLLGIYFGG